MFVAVITIYNVFIGYRTVNYTNIMVICYLCIASSILGSKYEDVIYSMNVWHKSKSIKKCLTKVSMLQHVSV